MRPPSYRQSLFVGQYLGELSGVTLDAPRQLGTNGLTGWDRACLEMSRFLAFWAPEMPENPLVSVQLTTFVVRIVRDKMCCANRLRRGLPILTRRKPCGITLPRPAKQG